MAFIAATSDALAPAAESSGIVRRMVSAIMEVRQAQAEWRLAWQLRDLPDHVLYDIGLRNTEVKRLRARQSAYLSG